MRDQVRRDGGGTHEHKCKQRGQSQVIGDARHDTRKLGQGRNGHKAKIVIVDIAAGEPGIVGRKDRALDDRVEIGKIHGLFATHGRMPEVRVAIAHGQHGPKGQEIAGLNGQQRAPLCAQHRLQTVPLCAGCGRSSYQEHGEHQDQGTA